MATATIEAPAKVNLTLEILGSRPDGYHELRSVVMPVSLFEGVSVSTRADDAVTCETRGEGVDASELEGLPLERQLAVKAVRAMQRRLGRTGPGSGVDVRVSKRVPIGAGMGGGSADAAGVLACLRALWAPGMPEEELLEELLPEELLLEELPEEELLEGLLEEELEVCLGGSL